MTRARNGFLAVAMAIVFGGLLLAPEPPPWWRLALAMGAVIVAQQLVLRLRVGAAVLSLAWVETALVVTLVLMPTGWVPLTVAAGSAVGLGLRRLRSGQEISLPSGVRAVANAGVAAAAAALVAIAWGEPYGTEPTAQAAIGLALAALTYLLVNTVITCMVSGRRYHMSIRLLLRRALWSKALMFVGNLTLGLTVIALAYAQWQSLLALPVAVWLLHRTYAHRLRVTERRRMWGAFATATRSLNRADEDEVARAGARGAVEVFAVGRVEVELRDRDGVRRVWVGDQTGAVHREPAGRPPPLAGYLAPATTVPLLVGTGEVGQLRVHFPRLVGPSHGEEAALQAYGDALAAAVHDAVTHQQLHRLLVTSASDAQRDPLTGLHNRAALVAHGETMVQLTRHATPVALLVVDIHHFREINETLGHAGGDEVLRVTGQRLRELTGPGELLARLAGDEFALLITDLAVPRTDATRTDATRTDVSVTDAELTDLSRADAAVTDPAVTDPAVTDPAVTDPAVTEGPAATAALARAAALAESLNREADICGVGVPIDASVGVVVAPAGTVELAELLRRAGVAMAQARLGQGGPVGWYDPAQDPGSSDRPALLADLRAALARDDELVLVLQPVVDLATGSPTELEALVRWHHPQRGLLPPADFVRVVENSDLLAGFTEYVVDKALAAAARQARRGPALPVAVNLSARSLLDPGLPRAVRELLRRHRVPGRRLVLEITETVVASELPGIEEALARLRSLGVRLSVDDFGTGHASLSFLTRVRLDAVKVDGTFVARMDSSPPAAAIVRTTIELGRELGLRVVAEGVETAEQRQVLTRLGCTAAQGFSVAEPIPAELIGERMLGPQLSGPQLSGPQLSGPQLSGPQLSGPQLSGPQPADPGAALASGSAGGPAGLLTSESAGESAGESVGESTGEPVQVRADQPAPLANGPA